MAAAPSTPADATLHALARLGAQLELAAAAEVDLIELDGLVRDFDQMARIITPTDLTQAQRSVVEVAAAQVRRVLSLMEQRLARDAAAHGRDQRLRLAYGGQA